MKNANKNLKRIGHTANGDDKGNTVIYVDQSTANIEIILLEQILDSLGFKILKEEDWVQELTVLKGKKLKTLESIKVTTNYPFKLYLKQQI